MSDPLNLKKRKPPFEINWKIREIFSETALASFCEEVENKFFDMKENKFD